MADGTPDCERCQSILLAIAMHIENEGYPPSIRDLIEPSGLATTSSVVYHMRDLEEAGYLDIVRERSRAMRLTVAGRAAVRALREEAA